MSARWYKRCGADFIHGTMMLTLEEKGAYSLCLDLIYDRGGPIPDDARWLSGVCGVSLRKWASIRERLLSLGKIAAENGHLTNSRAALELVSAELSARKLAEAGSKGGRKRAENQFDHNVISDLAQATLKLLDKRREDKKEPPNPLAGGRRGKTVLPEDWALPPIEDLPPKARACAEQWTKDNYETRGEEFISFWRSRGRMMKDWRLTWAGRVVDLHSQVMRDQKFGNSAPVPIGRSNGAAMNAQQLRSAIAFAEDHDNPERAAELRRELAKIVGPPPGKAGTIIHQAAAGMRQ
jgi:uncharacterized protein YdaU (DUF1376 family)